MIESHQQDVGEYLKDNPPLQKSVILDPPRTGAMKILPFLGDHVRRIVYVSCGLKSLAKELTYLCTQGYSITSVHLLDMFPQTRHFETVVFLERIW